MAIEFFFSTPDWLFQEFSLTPQVASYGAVFEISGDYITGYSLSGCAINRAKYP